MVDGAQVRIGTDDLFLFIFSFLADPNNFFFSHLKQNLELKVIIFQDRLGT